MAITKQELKNHSQKLRVLYATERFLIDKVGIPTIAKELDVSDAWASNLVGLTIRRLGKLMYDSQTGGVQTIPFSMATIPPSLVQQTIDHHSWMKENFTEAKNKYILDLTLTMFEKAKAKK